ncbi:hypothetical protein M413DRAFT_28216 [Hebeloma cylindrosporum]|uniref:Uncharacterized protein n=1 Tax=Hebeloma cylindrosporum TaxID=76867 RepID=A0A0C3CC31_HEBCY|nr:hypothetical protein M413DRAFT_28216 [Hebeloma cylindrosporum h7]
METLPPITDPDANAPDDLLEQGEGEPELSQDSQPLIARNYIQSLPVETLDHIFTFCYWDATSDPLSEYLDAPGTAEMPELDGSEEGSDDEPEPNHALNAAARSARQARNPELMKSMENQQMENRVWNEAHLFDRTLFPYALAKVCNDWKHILLQRPYYWTRVVLSVDYENATPLEDAEEIFRITAPRLLEVSIGHYNTPDDDDDPKLEQKQVKGFVDILLQNLRRCRKISINVRSHASAPDDNCFEDHPRPAAQPSKHFIIGKEFFVTHSWCDESPSRWR